MAKLYIAEFSSMGGAPNAGPQMSMEPPEAEQTPVVIGGGSLQSAAFQPKTRILRLHCDVACSIAMGQNPTATVDNRRLAANQTEYFGVPEGGSFKVAVIENP